MASAPFLSQVINILLTPIIVRLYSPETMGLFQLFGSISTPLLIFANLGYGTPILLEKNEMGTRKLFQLNIFISLIFTILLAFLVLFFRSKITDIFHLELISNLFWTIPVSFFLYGVYVMFRYLNMKKSNMKAIARSDFLRNISTYFITLPLGIMGLATASSLIWGSLLSALVVSFVLILSAIKLGIINLSWFTKIFTYKELFVYAKKYKKFFYYNSLIDLFNRFAAELPIYIMAFYFSQAVIGYYGLGLRILRIPITYIGYSIGEVYYQRASTDNNSIVFLLEKILKYVIVLTLPIFIVLCIYGKNLFVFIFGSNWSEAGIYVQILSFHIFIKVITNQFSYLSSIYQKQEIYLLFTIMDIIVISVAFMIGGIFKSIFISLFLILIMSGIVNLIFGYYFYKLAGLNVTNVIKTFGKGMFEAIPIIILLIILLFTNLNDIISITIILTSLIIYYIYKYYSDEDLKLIINELASKIKIKMFVK